jgi:rhodanese-related sulfurtransferase
MKPIAFLSALLVLAISISCSSRAKSVPPPKALPEDVQNKPKQWLHHINANEAFLALKKKESPLVLDIRTPFEFNGERIKGAKLLNYYDQNFKEELGKLDKTKPIMVHCRSGGRSNESLHIFKELGFQNILHLDGGILAWEKAGYSLIKD